MYLIEIAKPMLQRIISSVDIKAVFHNPHRMVGALSYTNKLMVQIHPKLN